MSHIYRERDIYINMLMNDFNVLKIKTVYLYNNFDHKL